MFQVTSQALINLSYIRRKTPDITCTIFFLAIYLYRFYVQLSLPTILFAVKIYILAIYFTEHKNLFCMMNKLNFSTVFQI